MLNGTHKQTGYMDIWAILDIMYETQIDKIVELAVNLNICCNVFECALNFPWERQRYISMCT